MPHNTTTHTPWIVAAENDTSGDCRSVITNSGRRLFKLAPSCDRISRQYSVRYTSRHALTTTSPTRTVLQYTRNARYWLGKM